jgi:hypothetical protein
MADRIDGLFSLAVLFPLAPSKGRIFLTMNPCWPDMLLATRFVIAEDTGWELFDFIVSFAHCDAPPDSVF